MENIRFSGNLAALRKEKKITQEQLADFCEVTKASVSKWETGQTLPDIMMLPKISSFFGVTIDELLGYEMYLTKEQINRIYKELADEFAEKSPEVAIRHCREYVKQYYSCYEFLEKIILLWLAHEFIAGEKRTEMLLEAKSLCVHILENCRNIRLCNDVVFLQSIVDLLLGHPQKTIEVLEEISCPTRLSVQSEEVLLSAYIEQGMFDKGDGFAQVSMYLHVLMLISAACRFVIIHKENLEKCKETHRRIDEMIQLYNMEHINFYYVTLFAYQMAEIYSYHGEKRLAVEQLSRYAELTERFLRGEISYMQSDEYMDGLSVWFEDSVLMGDFPRGKMTAYKGLKQALETEKFESLKDYEPFLILKKRVKEMEKFAD